MVGICLPIDASGGVPAFPAAQHRVAQAALMGAVAGRPLGARSGLRPGATPTVTVTSTTWTVTPFAGVVDTGAGLAVGPYLVAFLANETGGINAADGSAQRLDRLSVLVPDDPPVGARTPSIVYTAGVPGSGVAPAVPARSADLGVITVPKAGTGAPSFAAGWNHLAAPGGRVLVRSQAERDALPLYSGLMVHRLDTGNLESYHGGAWRTEFEVGADQGRVAFAPAWTGTGGGAVALGTGGSLGGWYRRAGNPMADWEVALVTGADASGPAGDYQFSLPFTVNCRSGRETPIGTATFIGGANVLGQCVVDPAVPTKFKIRFHGSAGFAASGNPAVWGNRTVIFSGRCETT